jgi:nitrogen fixation NifU-like protein
MTELRELYQQVILDHNKNPRNFHRPDATNREQQGHNPLCGDELQIYLYVDEDDVIQDIGFEGSGCAISKASASLMTDALKGKPAAAARDLFERFRQVVTGEVEAELIDDAQIGKLVVFAGVREFPMRVKCATLAWHTMRSALDSDQTGVTTE